MGASSAADRDMMRSPLLLAADADDDGSAAASMQQEVLRGKAPMMD